MAEDADIGRMRARSVTGTLSAELLLSADIGKAISTWAFYNVIPFSRLICKFDWPDFTELHYLVKCPPAVII
jgi:hypothetical protein